MERMVNELIIGNKSTLSTIFHAKAYYISFDTNELEEFREYPRFMASNGIDGVP